jgi:flagellar motor component MotA
MDMNQINGIIRTILAALGGYFASKMKIDAETMQALVGACTTIIVAVWSIAAKMPMNNAPTLMSNEDMLKSVGRQPRSMMRRPKLETEEEFYTGEKFDIPQGIRPNPTATNSGM